MSNLMKSINPFDFYNKFLNPVKYEKDIYKFIKKLTKELSILINKSIDENLTKYYFWDLLKHPKNYNPFNGYHLIASLTARLLLFKILYKADYCNKKTYQLNQKWFKYLKNRIIPYESDIPIIFFAKISTNYPVINKDSTISLFKENKYLTKEENLRYLLESPVEDPYKKVLRFKETYKNYYGIFLGRCEYLGVELSKYEGNKKIGRYGNNIYNIFQLKNNNKETPPQLISDLFFSLIHIRNAIAHHEKCIIIKSDINKIQILDFNRNGKQTYNEVLDLKSLWDYYYYLISLDIGINTIALYFNTIKNIRIIL